MLFRVEGEDFPRQTFIIMADITVFHSADRAVRHFHAERRAAVPINRQRLRAFPRVTGGDFRRNGRGIGQTETEKARFRVLENGGDMIGDGIALRLPLLRHNVADVEFERRRTADRVHDAIH